MSRSGRDRAHPPRRPRSRGRRGGPASLERVVAAEEVEPVPGAAAPLPVASAAAALSPAAVLVPLLRGRRALLAAPAEPRHVRRHERRRGNALEGLEE